MFVYAHEGRIQGAYYEGRKSKEAYLISGDLRRAIECDCELQYIIYCVLALLSIDPKLTATPLPTPPSQS